MSQSEIDYHLEKLRLYSGCDWVRDYSIGDPVHLLSELEAVRRKRAAYTAFERTAWRMAYLGIVMFVVGLTLAVYSAMHGIDWGGAAAAFILPGVFLPVAGWGGAFLLRFNLLDRLDDEVRALEGAYNTALLKTGEGE